MTVLESLFASMPELFGILEEVQSYTNQVVIPVGLGGQEYANFQGKDSMFPMITLTNLAINLIIEALNSLSHSFLVKMMEKHRFQLKT